jgi:hypothetical protein
MLANNRLIFPIQFYSASLEERKSQLLHELDGHFSSKQVAISAYTQKAQETVDKVYQVPF